MEKLYGVALVNDKFILIENLIESEENILIYGNKEECIDYIFFKSFTSLKNLYVFKQKIDSSEYVKMIIASSLEEVLDLFIKKIGWNTLLILIFPVSNFETTRIVFESKGCK